MIRTLEFEDLVRCLRYGYDPIVDRIVNNIRSRKRKINIKTGGNNRKDKPRHNKRSQRFAGQEISRYSLVIPVFLRDDGYAEIRIQRDINDNGLLKGKMGFVIGRADTQKETYEETALREMNEETLVPESIGKLIRVDVIKTTSNYTLIAFIDILPFDTVDGKGTDVYSHSRYSVEDVMLMTRNCELLLDHGASFTTALAKGLIPKPAVQ